LQSFRDHTETCWEACRKPQSPRPHLYPFIVGRIGSPIDNFLFRSNRPIVGSIAWHSHSIAD